MGLVAREASAWPPAGYSVTPSSPFRFPPPSPHCSRNPPPWSGREGPHSLSFCTCGRNVHVGLSVVRWNFVSSHPAAVCAVCGSLLSLGLGILTGRGLHRRVWQQVNATVCCSQISVGGRGKKQPVSHTLCTFLMDAIHIDCAGIDDGL
eukprot:533646-Pyramimonas_sp.AAC.1